MDDENPPPAEDSSINPGFKTGLSIKYVLSNMNAIGVDLYYQYIGVHSLYFFDKSFNSSLKFTRP
jgi:hypothetical protein